MFRRSIAPRSVGAPVVALVLLLATAAPAAAMEVGHKQDAAYDFSALHTFDWLPRSDASPVRPGGEVDRQIRAAVEERLAKKGFEPARQGGADFLLHYDAGLQERVDVSGAERHLHAGDGPRVTFAWEEGEQARIYSEGSLVIEVVDAETREVVWAGWATDVAKEPDRLRKRVDKAVKKILKPFPPTGR